MWMFVGKTLSEKLKFAADILQAVNIFLALVAGIIIWYELELFAGILSTVFLMFVTWAIKLSMYALSQLSAQLEALQTQHSHEADSSENQTS